MLKAIFGANVNEVLDLSTTILSILLSDHSKEDDFHNFILDHMLGGIGINKLSNECILLK